MDKFRYGYMNREKQARLTPKSAFLRKLERTQRRPATETHWFSPTNVHPIGARRAAKQPPK
jgi:hypothetical protein